MSLLGPIGGVVASVLCFLGTWLLTGFVWMTLLLQPSSAIYKIVMFPIGVPIAWFMLLSFFVVIEPFLGSSGGGGSSQSWTIYDKARNMIGSIEKD